MNKQINVGCDECGRSDKGIHRVYEGHRYCSTCYARVFKTRICVGCGELKRLPFNQPDAVCARCRASKPCVRCGKVGSPVGLMSDYGPVCNSCSPHFRVEEPCDGCGKPSSELSKVTRFHNDLRLCRSCQRSDYETCPGCHRYRQLVIGNDGVRRCKLCVEHRNRHCQSCGKLMPGGRVTECEDCYWVAATRKRIAINQHIFCSPTMTVLFVSFGDWLIKESGAKSAALSINRYLSFFSEVEKLWRQFPSYEALVGHFKAEGLRRVRRPMRWLRETQKLDVDSVVRENTSEECRIESMLRIFSADVIACRVINGYVNKLLVRNKQGKTSLRSIRLALTPAVHLLRQVSSTGQVLPDQKSLDGYLATHPGQQAAITGFINYINTNFSLDLAPRVDERLVAKLRKKKLEEKLSRLITGDGLMQSNIDAWLAPALVYFHKVRLPKKRLMSATNLITSIDASGITVCLNGNNYYLPLSVDASTTE